MTAGAPGDRPAAALAGIPRCDLSGQLAGAGATRYLAAFGAEVIRVEDPTNKGGWDIIRASPPFVDDRRGIDLGGGFNNHNVGKWGVTLNLRTDEGRGDAGRAHPRLRRGDRELRRRGLRPHGFPLRGAA